MGPGYFHYSCGCIPDDIYIRYSNYNLRMEIEIRLVKNDAPDVHQHLRE